MGQVADNIVKVALSYLGQDEISGNKGFKNKAFQKKMEDCGWHIGDSWCAFFSELIWKEGYGKSSPYYNQLNTLFSPSATATYSNFAGSKTFRVGTKPAAGALAVWQYGKGWQGHIGVVVNPAAAVNVFATVEGNTNNDGSREGYTSCKKSRKLDEPFKPKGLNLIGFVYVTE